MTPIRNRNWHKVSLANAGDDDDDDDGDDDDDDDDNNNNNKVRPWKK